MDFKKVSLYYYSPTGTGEKIITEIGRGICPEPIRIVSNCITYPEFKDSVIEPEPEDLVVVAAPVYAGRVAKTAIERLNQIKFSGNMAVMIAVYGNRHFDDALIELREWAIANGLKPVAFGAFVGEHSYSRPRDPIGHGRPDELDCFKAHQFGQIIAEKFHGLDAAKEAEIPEIPGAFPLPDHKILPKVAPETVHERCVKCGVCQTVCPTGAVYFEKKQYHTNADLCTLCCACVKECKHDARVIRSEHYKKVCEWLLGITKERREPETFL
jgi:ferredoxin